MSISEIRTQIYLERSQHKALKRLAHKRSISMAQVVREAVESYVTKAELDEMTEESYMSDPAWSLPEVGERFEGTGRRDASANHDLLLYGEEDR